MMKRKLTHIAATALLTAGITSPVQAVTAPARQAEEPEAVAQSTPDGLVALSSVVESESNADENLTAMEVEQDAQNEANKPVVVVLKDSVRRAPGHNRVMPKPIKPVRPVMPKPVKTVRISHCDSVLVPYAAAGLEKEGARLMQAPLSDIDIKGLDNLMAAAGMIEKEAPQLQKLVERVELVKRAAAVDRALKNYFAESLYSPSEAYSLNRLLQFDREGLTPDQCATLEEDSDMLSRYDIASMYFLYVTEAIADNPEIADMVSIKGNPALIRATVRNILAGDVNGPRVEEIAQYPALSRKLDQYIEAIVESDMELATQLRDEVDSTMNAPQARPL